MEDRITPGLYLEMIAQPIDAYARDRVPEVLARPGARRATWWRNVKRDRADLPAVLPEFDHLGVYEVDDTFQAPEPAAGISGHHFRHYPRPGQGIVTVRTIGKNQRGEVVCAFRRDMLIPARGQAVEDRLGTY